MRVFEILINDLKNFSEQQVIDRLNKFDWDYEFSDDSNRIRKATKELELIENMIYRLWKNNPENAVKLWNENIPNAPEDKTTVPSFIFRLESQER